jgi:serine/threonine-protein kinase RsbT
MAEILRRICINTDMDVAVARLQAREVARALGFGTVDQARISLATSELARSLSAVTPVMGEVWVSRLVRGTRIGLQIEYVHTERTTGGPIRMADLVGAGHLMDECLVQDDPEHATHVTLVKWQAG